MKLLLASSGFTNEDIISACEKLVGKKRQNINFATINEAIKIEDGDHRWFAESLQEITQNFGGNIEFIDLQARPLADVRKRISECDAIFCFGGNTEYLAQVFRKTGFAEILPEILTEKVWVGSSAGSCVLCRKESAQTQTGVFGEQPMGEDYLNLVPAVILPHYQGWFKFDKHDVKREAEHSEYPVYALSDQSALKVTSTKNKIKLEVVGKDYCLELGRKFNDAIKETLDSLTL